MITVEEIAKQLYTTYCDGVGGVAYNGDKLPTADEFFTDPAKEKQVVAWTMAAATQLPVYQLLLETTQNLGHPAYGQSSSTTIAIDSLREGSFDFLRVLKDEDDDSYKTTAKSEGGVN